MKKILIATLLTFALVACSSTNTKVVHSVVADEQKESYVVEPNVYNEYDEYFDKALNKALQQASFKDKGELSDTIIQYTIDVDEGNRALRYFVGFGAGQARAIIAVNIIDRKTKELLANLNSEATLSMGIFGGEAKGILDNAAKDIVRKIEHLNLYSRINEK